MKTPSIAIVVLFGVLLLGGVAGSSVNGSWGKLFNAPPRKALLGIAIAPHGNGSFVVAGDEVLYGNGPQVVLCSRTNVSERVWVSKVTSKGQVEWLNVYSISGEVEGVAVTKNGSVVIDGNFDNSNSSVWVMKLNGRGEVLWARKYSVDGYAKVSSIAVGGDGSIILVGRAWVKTSLGPGLWVVKLNPNGDVEWSKVYDGKGSDWGSAVAVDEGENIVVAGTSDSFGNGYEDVWVLKLKENGSVVWQKTYGGSNNDEALGVAVDGDGGVVVVGRTWSFGANITDGWVLKLTPEGNVEWGEAYGGNGSNAFKSAAVGPNGEVYVAGYVETPNGEEYAWLLELNPNGKAAWQGTFGNGSDVANDVAVGREVLALVGTSFDMGTGAGSAFLLVQKLGSENPYFRKVAFPSRMTPVEIRESNASVISLTPFDITSATISVQEMSSNITATALRESFHTLHQPASTNTVTAPQRSICGPAAMVAIVLLPLLLSRRILHRW